MTAAYAPERKTERLELRVSRSVKQFIERAVAMSGLAAGDLAFEGARRVLSDLEQLKLTGADRKAFLDAVAKPPAPRAALVDALRAHRKLKR